MKLPEPLMERVASGDLASVQAVKKMNAAQAPKRENAGADPPGI